MKITTRMKKHDVLKNSNENEQWQNTLNKSSTTRDHQKAKQMKETT